MADQDRAADRQNPYEPPKTEGQGDSANPLQGVMFTAPMSRALGEARPWVAFLSVLGFITAGMMGVGGIGVILGASLLGDELGGGFGVAGGVLYLAFGLLYLFPALHLNRYARSIKSGLANADPQNLEAAFSHERSFWKFLGILSVIGLAITALVFVGLIVAGVVGALAS